MVCIESYHAMQGGRQSKDYEHDVEDVVLNDDDHYFDDDNTDDETQDMMHHQLQEKISFPGI